MFCFPVTLENIDLDLHVDYKPLQNGFIFMGIMGLKHEGKEIFPIVAPEVIAYLIEFAAEEFLRNPPTDEQFRLNDIQMAPFRETSKAYADMVLASQQNAPAPSQLQ